MCKNRKSVDPNACTIGEIRQTQPGRRLFWTNVGVVPSAGSRRCYRATRPRSAEKPQNYDTGQQSSNRAPIARDAAEHYAERQYEWIKFRISGTRRILADSGQIAKMITRSAIPLSSTKLVGLAKYEINGPKRLTSEHRAAGRYGTRRGAIIWPPLPGIRRILADSFRIFEYFRCRKPPTATPNEGRWEMRNYR